jgi:hypothetical protein
MNFRSIFLIPLISTLAACGGVDDEPDNPVDTSTISSCIQDNWTRTIRGTSGSVDLTFEFREDGTYVQRSHVDNISTAEYLGGIENTDLDLPVLPGLSIDVGMLASILGPFYAEGHFHAEGTWAVDEESGVLTTVLPKRDFGHSIWSAGSAERDFGNEVPDLSQVETVTDEKYVYCSSGKLAVGAYYKEDDSDIAGVWQGISNEIYVPSDYVGLIDKRLSETGSVSSSASYQMVLGNDGYSLGYCTVAGKIRGDRTASFFRIKSDNSIVPTGTKLPLATRHEAKEFVNGDYYYQVYTDGWKRTNIITGESTNLIGDGISNYGNYVAVPDGVLVQSARSLLHIKDASNRIVDIAPEGNFIRYMWELDGEIIAFDEDIGVTYKIDPVSLSLEIIPVEGNPSFEGTRNTPFLTNGELFIRRYTDAGLHTFWKYSPVDERFEFLFETEQPDKNSIILAGDGGYDISFWAYGNGTSNLLLHLDAANNYEVSASVSLDAVTIRRKGDHSSVFYVVERTGEDEVSFSMLNLLTGVKTLLAEPGIQVSDISISEDGSRVIYKAGGVFASEEDRVVVIHVDDTGAFTTQTIDVPGITGFRVAQQGDLAGFYINGYDEEGVLTSYLYSLYGADTVPELITDEYELKFSLGSAGNDFKTSTYHFAAPAVTEYSGSELLLFNPTTATYDYRELNTVPGVSSGNRFLGDYRGDTLIAAWLPEEACAAATGSLKFEGNYLWYEGDQPGFRNIQWFNR